MPRANKEHLNQIRAAAFAVSELKKKGFTFVKDTPNQKNIVREMKTSGLVDQEYLSLGHKEILNWYFEKNRILILKRKREIKIRKNLSDIKSVAIPSSIGYISRCRQDEPLDLNPEVFYKSWRWKEIRLIALDACGRRCVSCGAIPSSKNKVVLHVDHIKPLRHHPELALDLSNLQVLCEDCNQGKSWFNTKDYREDHQRQKLSDLQIASISVTEEALSRMHNDVG